jgi:hypothetical protein
MKCDEPLYEDGDEYSSRDCQSDLGHSGDHDYFGRRFPRPVVGSLAPELEQLLERAAAERNALGVDERQWPIVVEVTSVYVIKAPGNTEDEALAYWDGGDYPDLEGEQAIDGSFEIRRADRYQLDGLRGYTGFGPQVACPDCGRTAMQRSWYHDPFRKCHGPIEWREYEHAKGLRWRYSRDHKATPAITEAVTS